MKNSITSKLSWVAQLLLTSSFLGKRKIPGILLIMAFFGLSSNALFAQPCSITVQFFGNPSACNDNGTPNDPSDDFFTQNLNANFFNRPLTGSLQIVPGGDQIGTYSIPVNQITGNAHTFNSVMFKADGTPTNVQMNFTDEPSCIDAAVGPTVQSCSSAPPCSITVQFFGNPSACNDNGTPNDPSDDFFTQNLNANFFNRPLTGSLQIVPGGDQIGTYSIPVNQITGNTHTFNSVMFKADGTPTNVQMNFTDEPTCIDAAVGPTVQACSTSGPCSISSVSLQSIGSCNDNGTPNDPNDDFFTADVRVIFANPPSTGNLEIELPGDVVPGGGATSVSVVGLTSPHIFTGVRFKADGTTTVIEVQFSADQSCVRTATGPTVQPCSVPCSISSVSLQSIGSCNDNGTPNNSNDDFFTADVRVVFANPPGTGNLEIELPGDVVPGGGATSVSVVGLTSPHIFTGVRFKADGTTTVIEVQFSTLPACVRTATGSAVQPCSFPAPVLTCPPAVTVSCANEVPPANPASVTETHTCPGPVTITHLSDVNSSVFCINRLTITRTYRATDQCGNTATCTQTITVHDQTPPTVTCPPNLQVSCASQVPPIDVNSIGVTDNCTGGIGISRAFLGEVITNQTCTNRFTLTRTYRGGDACGNSATCAQVITVNNQTPPVVPPNGAATVSCPSQIVQPTPPVVTSNCGQPLTASGPVIVNNPNPLTCQGTRTFTFTFTDCEGNSAQWSFVYTVVRNDFGIPPNGASQVACPALITTPTPPVVTSPCGEILTPTGPVILNNPNPITCEGTRTFTYTYTDCAGHVKTWSHVTTVEREPFTITTPNGSATVDCPDKTDAAPTPPVVLSHCGEILVPVLFNLSAKPGCEGERLYTFRYTDCEGNFADWLFIYHVEYQDFAIPPSEVLTVECPLNASVPNPPVVFDNCGKLLTPTGPVITSIPNAYGCEGSRKFAFTYKDCEGNTHVWSKTFNFLYTADFYTYPDVTDVVACQLYAQPPVPPTIYDICGQEIKVALTGTSESISTTGCTGWRKFTFTYTDCGGHSHPWSFTYQINDNEAPLGVCPSGNAAGSAGGPVAVSVSNLSCIQDVPCPDDYDFGKKVEELLVAGNYFDVCSGNELVVTLDCYTDLWDCADLDGDGHFTFGRTFYFSIADPCGNEYPSLCEVTYSGDCLPIETFTQERWGETGGMPGAAISATTTDLEVIQTLLALGPLTVGSGGSNGTGRSLTLTDAQCVVDLLPGTGTPAMLANCHQINCNGPNGASCNPAGAGGMKNALAANTIALTLNLRFNQQYRGLGISQLRSESLGCIQVHECIVNCPGTGACQLRMFDENGVAHEFPYTIGGLLDMANIYLGGTLPFSQGQHNLYSGAINSVVQNVNRFWNEGTRPAACEPGTAALPIVGGEKNLTTGRARFASGAFKLVPNPASRMVRLELSGLDGEHPVVLEVFNTVGQMKLRKEYGKFASISERIDLDGLESGVYFVRLRAGGQRFDQKLVVNKD